jgi:hypothetical protein
MSEITQKNKKLKAINKILPEVTHVSVIDNEHEVVTTEADPDDEWGADSTATTHDITGITIHPTYGDIECAFDIEPEKYYYLLYYTYATGDSFSNHSGRIEFVELYRDEKLADKSCKALNSADLKKSHMVPIWNDLGQKYEEYVNDDYFGGFEGAEVVAVKLQ